MHVTVNSCIRVRFKFKASYLWQKFLFFFWFFLIRDIKLNEVLDKIGPDEGYNGVFVLKSN